VSFGGTLYSNTATDEITMLEAYVSKVANRAFTVSKGKVKFDFSDVALKEQSFTLSEDATFTLLEGEKGETKTTKTLAEVEALLAAGNVLKGTLVAAADGLGTSLEFTATAPAAK
jgi:hypothetical protein